jgi:pilus assembly protein FimV
LWQALQKTPDDALQEALRLQAVERELRSLRDVTQQNAANMARMREEVERARGERGVAAGVVAALAALLLALLGWFGWRWYADHRLKRVGRWFEQNGEARMGAAPGDPAGGLLTQPAPVLREGEPASAAFAAAGAAAAVGAAALSTRSGPTPLGSITPAFPREDFQFNAGRNGSMRTVGVQELIDVHDKADFFLSIGEYDQAIALLEAHIYDDVETSALAWMDLLELFHSLGRRGDYERLRNEFRLRFNGQLPDFDHFDQPDATLEQYDRALNRIMELWPSPRVLELIEESIFCKPGKPGTEPFSLEAYRELVLLYHVAHELAAAPADAEEAPGTVTGNFDDTAEVALSPPPRAPASVAPRELLMVPPASARLGVDIDLGELPTLAGAAPASAARDSVAWPGAQPEAESRDLPPLDFDLDEPTGTASLDAGRKGS